MGGTDTSVVWDASHWWKQCFLKTNKQPSDQEHSLINNWTNMRCCNVFSLRLKNKLKVNRREKSSWKKWSHLSPVVTLTESLNWAGRLVPLREWWTPFHCPQGWPLYPWWNFPVISSINYALIGMSVELYEEYKVEEEADEKSSRPVLSRWWLLNCYWCVKFVTVGCR